MQHLAFEQYTLADLLNMTGDLPKQRALKSRVIGIRTRKNQRRFNFIVKSREEYSDADGHLVSLLYPNLPRLQHLHTLKNITPTSQRVRVYCSCPAWKYWGSAYWGTDEGYALTGLEDRPPDIRDPDGKNILCKHAVRVAINLQRISFARLLAWFGVPTAKQTASELTALREVAQASLGRRGWQPDLITAALDGWGADTFEDLLQNAQLMVPDELVGHGSDFAANFLTET